jgi:hypothetical protein
MKLTALASKPQLITVVLDDEEVIEQYGEAIEFYTWDKQPLDTYLSLASMDYNDQRAVMSVVKTLILDENGKEIVTDDNVLPVAVLLKAITKLTESLGKL